MREWGKPFLFAKRKGFPHTPFRKKGGVGDVIGFSESLSVGV